MLTLVMAWSKGCAALFFLGLGGVVACGTHGASATTDSGSPRPDTGSPLMRVDAGHVDAGHVDASSIADSGTARGDAVHDAQAASDAASDAAQTGDVSVVIAAAGDISDPAIDDQKTTSNLVIAGHYDAVLTLGDNQYNDGTGTEFADYFAPTWGRFKANIFPALGNHEYSANPPASGYFGYFFGKDAGPNNPRITDPGASDTSKGYYSFDLGAWHIIALNTNTASTENAACGVIPCSAGSAQEVWLKADLAAHTNVCTLAYWHQARFTAGCHTNDTDLGALWDDLYAANADVILNGHDHDYQRFVPMNTSGVADPQHGIVEFIVGTGGTTISCGTSGTPPSTLAKSESGTFGILRLTLHPTSYDYEFLAAGDAGVSSRDGGAFTDKGTGLCH